MRALWKMVFIFWGRRPHQQQKKTCVVLCFEARSVKLANLFVHNDYHITENSQLKIYFILEDHASCWFIITFVFYSSFFLLVHENEWKSVWAWIAQSPIDNLYSWMAFPKKNNSEFQLALGVNMAQAGHFNTGALTHHIAQQLC